MALMTEDARVTAALRLFQPDTLDVMNTSGGERLVALIKVTGGRGVGRAEAGDKTARRRRPQKSRNAARGVARSTELISLVGTV